MLFAPRERGQGLLEYAMIIILVAVLVIVVVYLIGPATGNMYSNVVKVI
ncbi:MAG: pilus assembly protein [Anaerolineaceae bacterium]